MLRSPFGCKGTHLTDNYIPLLFRTLEADTIIQLELDTFRPLVGELRLVRPKLAAAIEQAGFGYTEPLIELGDGDAATLSLAARVLRESLLLDDPALEQLAQL